MAKKPSKPKKATQAKKKPDPFKKGAHPLKRKLYKACEEGKDGLVIVGHECGLTVTLAKPEALTGPVEGYVMAGHGQPQTTGAKFTIKEQLFIYNYVSNKFNGTQAAIDAGYDVADRTTAASIASENLRKPHIRAEVDRLVAEKLMSREEALIRISDMARGSLNDYLRIVTKPHKPMIKRSLRVLIEGIKAKIEDQEKFIARANIQNKDRLKNMANNVITWTEQIVEYEIELERNPGAFRECEGEEVLIDTVELDLVKLSQDKERGLIKTLTPMDGGFKVELYGADGALRDIGKYHGIFEKDNTRWNMNSVPLTPEEIKKINQELEKDY